MNEHRSMSNVLECTLSIQYEVKKPTLPGQVPTREALVPGQG
jgi:hypothetical protein